MHYCPKAKVSFKDGFKSRKSLTSNVSITVFRDIMKIIVRTSQTSETSQTSWRHRVFKDITVIKETKIVEPLGPNTVSALLPKEKCLNQHYRPQCSLTLRCHPKMIKIIVAKEWHLRTGFLKRACPLAWGKEVDQLSSDIKYGHLFIKMTCRLSVQDNFRIHWLSLGAYIYRAQYIPRLIDVDSSLAPTVQGEFSSQMSKSAIF